MSDSCSGVTARVSAIAKNGLAIGDDVIITFDAGVFFDQRAAALEVNTFQPGTKTIKINSSTIGPTGCK